MIYSRLIIFIILFGIKINLNEGFGSIQRKWDFLLPREMMERIFALESDAQIDKMEVERSTDELLRVLPKTLLDQLELPQFYAGLPFSARLPIRELLFDSGLDWQQKHQRIFQIIQNVPPILRKFGPTFWPPFPGQNGPPPKRHSRLFDSVRALKYSVNFTFQLKELRDALPMEKFTQIYNILEDNSENIEQKMLAIEGAMGEMPLAILNKLFESPNGPQIRDKFRQFLFGRPNWNLAEGNENNLEQFLMAPMEQPILVWPSPSPPPPSFGRVSILAQQPIQIHQKQQNAVDQFPAGKTTISIDEHYNVLAPGGVPKEGGGNVEGELGGGAFWGDGGGLCAECNGIPKQMFSVGDIPRQKMMSAQKGGKGGIRIRIPKEEEEGEMGEEKWANKLVEEETKEMDGENNGGKMGENGEKGANLKDEMEEIGNKKQKGIYRRKHLVRNHLRVQNMNRLLVNILDDKGGLGAMRK